MGVYLDVDISQLQTTIEKMRAVHTKREFELVMYRAFRRTGEHVKTILKQNIPKEYRTKKTWIGENVGKPQTKIGGFGGSVVSCSIPLRGARGKLGAGSAFHAAGPRGRRSKHRRKYKITARILNAATSTLPETMPANYGGQPPFLTQDGSKVKGGLVFTRSSKERLPIKRVAAIGVPQMPMNRAADDVQKDIVITLKRRMEHEHEQLIGRCRL